MHGAVLEARQLPPGANLKRTFVIAMLEWIDAGWEIAEFTSRLSRLMHPVLGRPASGWTESRVGGAKAFKINYLRCHASAL